MGIAYHGTVPHPNLLCSGLGVGRDITNMSHFCPHFLT